MIKLFGRKELTVQEQLAKALDGMSELTSLFSKIQAQADLISDVANEVIHNNREKIADYEFEIDLLSIDNEEIKKEAEEAVQLAKKLAILTE